MTTMTEKALAELQHARQAEQDGDAERCEMHLCGATSTLLEELHKRGTFEVFQPQTPTNAAEIAAILGSLRLLQRSPTVPAEINAVLTSDGELVPLSLGQIDALCERLNIGGAL